MTLSKLTGPSSATTASANTFTWTTPAFGVSIPVGDTVFVLVTERHLSSIPVFSSVTDSAGNIYTRDGSGGQASAPLYLLRANVTHAIASTATLTVTFATNACDEIDVLVLRLDSTASRSGTPPTAVAYSTSSATHAFTLTAPNAGDLVVGGDVCGGSGGTPVTTSGASQLGTQASPNRAIAAFTEIASGSADTVTDTWSSSHIGTILAVPYTVSAAPTVPGAPTAVTATAGNAQATVSFTPPASNGGSAITSYTATSTPGGHTGSGTSSPITVSGLTNGTAYTFTVHATNSVGNSAESSASNSVTPAVQTSVSFVDVQATAVLNNTAHADYTLGTVTAPVVGNLLLYAGGCAKGSQVTFVVPTGFTPEIAQISNGSSSTNVNALADFRFATSLDASATYEWGTGSTFANRAGAILEYSGVSPTTPFDVTASNNTNALTLSATTATPGARLVYVAIFNASAVLSADQAAWNRRQYAVTTSGTADIGIYIADFVQSAAGATGNIGPSWTTAPTQICSMLLALRPAGVAANTPPTANAGTDQSVTAGVLVTLDGSGSSDADSGDSITYLWSHVSGPFTGSLSNPALPKPTYTPTTSGVDVWQLTVTDTHGATGSDTVSITAANRSPVAVGGADQRVALGATVTLDGSASFDPDTGDTLAYLWSAVSGPNAAGSFSTAAFSYAGAKSGTDVWQLTVTDNHGATSTDTVNVVVGASGVKVLIGGSWVNAEVKVLVSGAWVGA